MRRVVGIKSSSLLQASLIFHKILKSNPFHCQSCLAQTFQWEEGWPILWNILSGRGIMLREVEIGQFPSSKLSLILNKFWSPSLPTASLTTSRLSIGRKIDTICGTTKRIYTQHIGCSNKSDLNFPPLLREEIANFSRNGQWKGMESENSRFLLPGITSAGFYYCKMENVSYVQL